MDDVAHAQDLYFQHLEYQAFLAHQSREADELNSPDRVRDEDSDGYPIRDGDSDSDPDGDLGEGDWWDDRALVQSVSIGDEVSARHLLKRGDISADFALPVPLLYYNEDGEWFDDDDDEVTALQVAVRKGLVEMVRLLLTSLKVDPSYPPWDCPLALACRDICDRRLLTDQNSADLQARKREIVGLLLDDERVLITAVSGSRDLTPLDYAIYVNEADIVQLFLDKRAGEISIPHLQEHTQWRKAFEPYDPALDNYGAQPPCPSLMMTLQRFVFVQGMRTGQPAHLAAGFLALTIGLVDGYLEADSLPRYFGILQKLPLELQGLVCCTELRRGFVPRQQFEPAFAALIGTAPNL